MGLRGTLSCWHRTQVLPRRSSSKLEARVDKLQLVESIVFHLQV